MASFNKDTPPSSPVPSGGGGGKAPSSSGILPVSSKIVEDDPCTDRCRSKQHGQRIWEIAQGGGEDVGVIALWTKTCLNYSQVKDDFGRTALHAAATNGNLKAVEWLIKTQPCNINAKDFISGYTPLHRSIYFGHLHIARTLIKQGADLNIRDNEGLTPLELCQMDRPIPFKQNPGDITELTVWGSNANYNLGLGHQAPRVMPDVVDKFRKQTELSLTKVEMHTYHTMFLTQNGKAYTCGYGMGGRLGTGEETTVLNPTPVHLRLECKSVAVGQDHTVFLTDSKVWTVGSNEFGQLGQSNRCPRLFNPRSVDSLQKYGVTDILASSVHSVFYNESVILMCGLNQGQFGRSIGSDVNSPVNVYSPAIMSDRLPLDSVGNGLITTVGGNEHCTAVCIENRYIFLMRRYQHTRIDARNTTSQEILKIQATGEKHTITLFMLTSSGRVLVWRENFNRQTNEARGAFTRLVFSSSRLLDVKDFTVNQSSLVVITGTGEAYKAGWNINNPPVIVGRMEERYGQVAAADFQIAVRMRRGGGGRHNMEATPMALEQMKIKRVPNVHTGLAVSSDVKGHNFAILQRHQMMDVTDIPYVGESSLRQDLVELYQTAGEEDNVHDVLFDLGFEKFPAHKFILATASPVIGNLVKELQSSTSTNDDPLCIKVTNSLFGVDPSKCASLEDGKTFKAILDMIYTGACFMTTESYVEELRACVTLDGKKKGQSYGEKLKGITNMRNLCRLLQFDAGVSLMQDLISALALLQDKPDALIPIARGGPLSFIRDSSSPFTDVTLQSTDKVLITAHKCILAARLEYFKSMFSTNWSQGFIILKKKAPLSLPFSSKAISALLDYVYTDNENVVKDAEFDLLWETLATSDYMMVDRLMNIAESELTKNISLKNVADVLGFAWNHNAPQLRNTCFDFISLNLTAMLENKLLESLSTEIVEAFGKYYRNVQERNLSFKRDLEACVRVPDAEEYTNAVAKIAPEMLDQLQDIEESDGGLLVKKTPSKPTRSRVRLRSRTLSESDSVQEQQQQQQDPLNQDPKLERTIEESRKYTPVGGSPAVAGAGGTPAGPDRKLIVPLPRNTFPIGDSKKELVSLKSEDFPSLGDLVAASSPPQRVHLPPPPLSPPVVTQSGKKPMDLVFADNKFKNSVNTWGGQSQASSTVKPRFSAESAPVASTSEKSKVVPKGASGGGAKKKTKWRAIKSDKDIIAKAEVPGEASAASGIKLTADGRDRNNPWQVKTKAEVTFKDIVKDEVEKKINFEKAISKPLPMMQIEDEAINFLTQRYSSEDTADFIELLTVERVVSSNFCTPTWVQHPGAIMSAKQDHIL